jgi:uncharacterized protein (DUF779 family)
MHGNSNIKIQLIMFIVDEEFFYDVGSTRKKESVLAWKDTPVYLSKRDLQVVKELQIIVDVKNKYVTRTVTNHSK